LRVSRAARLILCGFWLARALYCHANMKLAYHFAAAAALGAVMLASPGARAAEDAPFGFSVDAYAAPTWDRSIINQQTREPRAASRGAIGLATVLNFDALALGAVVDGMPGIMGDGRVSLGGLAGWQPRIGSHRYQVLGELGAERFSEVGGTLLSAPSARETWLDYAGFRLGVSETFGGDGPFELGAWVFVRKDLGQADVSGTSGNFFTGEETTTSYRLGGYSGGVALRVGVRFDQKRSSAESAVPVEYEPAGT
jgi:hypothetical protein